MYTFVRNRHYVNKLDSALAPEVLDLVECETITEAIKCFEEFYQADTLFYNYNLDKYKHKINFHDSSCTKNMRYSFTIENIQVSGHIQNLERKARDLFKME